MGRNLTIVDFKEEVYIKVGRHLLKKGFDLATNGRKALSEEEALGTKTLDAGVGILYRDPNNKPKRLFGFITWRPRSIYLGTLWINNSARGGSSHLWILETQGRQYLELVKQLAEEIASTFNVEIRVDFQCEKPTTEVFWWEDLCD